MQKVRDFIDETDVRLELAGDVGEEDVERLVEQIYEKFNNARDTAEINRPSTYAHQIETGAGDDDMDHGEGSRRTAVRRLLARSGGTVDGNSSAKGKGKGKYVID